MKLNNAIKGSKSLKLSYWQLLAVLFLAIMLFFHYYQFSINVMSSLPQKYWLIATKQTPKRGDYVCLRPSQRLARIYQLSWAVTFTKKVVGVEGDNVTVKDRDFYINGQYTASAKTHSLKNEPMELGPTGVLAKEQYFVYTPHPDSFDSRYAEMGWVDKTQIIGVAYPLW